MRTTTITALSNGTKYEFRVSANTDVGAGTASAAATAKPAGKPAPVKALLKSAIKKITVTWVGSASNGAVVSGYIIQRSLNGKTWGTAVTVKPSVRAWSWTQGTKGKRYYFRIGVKSNFATVWGPAAYTTAR